MKKTTLFLNRFPSIRITCLAALLTASYSQAVPLYWDANGTAAGALNGPQAISASGIWGTDSFWTTDASGTAAGTYQSTTTSSDTLYMWVNPTASAPLISDFATNTTYTVTVNGTRAANGIVLQAANSNGTRVDLTFTGGQIDLGSGGITQSRYAFGTTGNTSRLTFNSTLNLTANQTWALDVSTSNGGVYIGGNLIGSGNILRTSTDQNSYLNFQSGSSVGWTGSLTLDGGNLNFSNSQQATTRLNSSTLTVRNNSATSSINFSPDYGGTTNFANNIAFTGTGANGYNFSIPNSGSRGGVVNFSGTLSGNLNQALLFQQGGTVDLSGTGQFGAYRISGNNSGFTSSLSSGAVVVRTGYLYLDSINALGANNSLSVQIGAYNTSARNASGLLASNGITVGGNILVTSKAGATGEAFLGLDGTGSALFTGGISLTNASTGSFVNNLHLRALAGGTATFSGNFADGNINGTGANVAVIVDGGGTVVLKGANSTYYGNTVVNAGTLQLDFATSATANNILNTAFNRSALVMGGGTLNLVGKAATTNSQRFNGTTFATGSSAITLSSAASNPLSLSLGAITRNAGSTVDFTLPTGTQSATNGVTTTSTTFLSNNVLVGAASNGVAFATVGGNDWASLSGSNLVALSSYNVNSFNSTDNTDITSDQTPASDITVNTLRFNDATARTLTLSGVNTVSTGGILATANTAANGSTITGGSLRAGGGNELVVINNGKLAIDSALVDNAAASALTISGSGVTTLTGANTYTGVTTVNSGTLSVSNVVVSGGSSNLGNATSAVVLGDGGHKGTLSYTGNSATYTRGFVIGTGGGEIDVTTAGQTLTIGTGTITPQSTTGTYGDLTIGGAGNTTFTSSLGLAFGGLVKNGAGTLLLSAANAYSGTTTINAGILQLGIATGLSTTSPVVVNGGTLNLGGFATGSMLASVTLSSGSITNGTFNLGSNTLYAASGTVSAILNGGGSSLNGSLVKTGAGTLVLSGANGYSGANYLNGGVVQISAANNLGNSGASNSIIFNGGTLNSTANSYNLGRAVALTGNGTLKVDAGTVTANGIISGAGNLTKSGAGSLSLSAANTYTGATQVTGGTLVLASAGTINTSSSVNVSSGATFDYSAKTSGTSVSGIAGAGTFKGLAGQSLTLTGGTIAAGDGGVGTLIVSAGDLSLNGTTFRMEIGGSQLATTNDLVSLTGATNTVSFAGINNLVLSNVGTLSDPVGKSFILFDGVASIGSAGSWTIDYGTTGWTGGIVSLVGGNVVLSGLTAVPEPSVTALLGLFGAGALLIRARSRNRRIS